MKLAAIICEYNPFTYGHKNHIEKIRLETKCDTICCIMSGSFTQRGEPAVLDKYDRAIIATNLGADIVIELPTIYAISPADNFAYGALKILSVLPNIEYLCFGSECGNITLLEQCTDFILNEPENFKSLLSEKLKDGYNYPKAYSLALFDYAKTNINALSFWEILEKPNNCLAVCYIKAAKLLKLNIKFHTLKRESNDNDDNFSGIFPSAKSIRNALYQNRIDEVRKYVPPFCFEQLKKVKNPNITFGDLCLFKLKSSTGYELMNCYDMDVGGGLHNRMKLIADNVSTFDKFLENCKTKKYTLARLKRLSLYNLLDITEKMYSDAITYSPYINILTLKKDRKDILSSLNISCKNVLTRYSDIQKIDKNVRLLIKLDLKAQGILNLINHTQSFNKSMTLI